LGTILKKTFCKNTPFYKEQIKIKDRGCRVLATILPTRRKNMKILALEQDVQGVKPEQFPPHLKAEALQVYQLHLQDVLREIYFRQDRHAAVLVLECKDLREAQQVIGTLPLVREGLIQFELIPLAPYPGLARLFADQIVY
jgi:hypothetical protein